jgi:hypothetical protein
LVDIWFWQGRKKWQQQYTHIRNTQVFGQDNSRCKLLRLALGLCHSPTFMGGVKMAQDN